jgi:salicylate hydroxylase
MNTFKDDLEWSFYAHTPLKVIIVGGGIAGLTTAIGLKRAGHDVTILEQVRGIAEVGVGIQMAPNAARIMGRFGLLEKIMEKRMS